MAEGPTPFFVASVSDPTPQVKYHPNATEEDRYKSLKHAKCPRSLLHVFRFSLRTVVHSPGCSAGEIHRRVMHDPPFLCASFTQKVLQPESIFKRDVFVGFEVNPEGIPLRPWLLRSTDKREHEKEHVCPPR